MSLITNMKEAKDMMLRVYNGKAIVSDAEKNIKGDHLIFTVYDKKRLLSFDFESKKFGLVEFADFFFFF